jgi:ribosomal protein S18 acetylase RimI-like enzyme
MASHAQSTRESAEVREAEVADLTALVRMFVRAYMDDPIAVWICKSPRLRANVLAALYSSRLEQMLGQGGVWTNAERSSAAVWVAPDLASAPVAPSASLLSCLLRPSMLVRLPMLAVGMKSMQRRHPRGAPHWYLSLLGTDPDARGHGWGSAMLRPVLDRCDDDGVGAYLESSKPRNIPFYTRHGFRVLGELRLPGGPLMWPMWREPSKRRR